ncbi:ion channel [uncultured Sulfitobacter sp.]|uniref:ion channel n=1 Tax=uncultured Sulfitobacter sp. TaxID=191468 RepID=UPI0026220544|nr:ion channel [uncultured Sulfitobacter sp.]
MFFALFVGSVMMISSLALSIVLFGVAARMLRWLEQTRSLGYERLPLVFDLGIAGLWILLVLTGSVWGWAALYMALGLFTGLEPALYFSIASFTTVGYGDVVLDPEWRLLAGMTATHGLLTFGLFTAFLVEVFNFPTRARRP